MLIKFPSKIPASEITPEPIYRARRDFMRGVVGAGAGMALSSAWAAPAHTDKDAVDRGPDWLRKQLAAARPDVVVAKDPLTPFYNVTHYNNFYEFGYQKEDPAANSEGFNPYPWNVEIAGEVGKPGSYHLEDLLQGMELEERVYRLRCVEAWSMVIPWIGFPLASLLKRFEPTSKAKYVAFTTLKDAKQFPEQKSYFSSIDWPYIEGLRMDEAMHPLTILAVGLYGKALPNQNGAPLRLVVPWKYGFKSIKSIVRIELTETQPKTTWSEIAPDEYGFYANVNPKVDHPRWSQATERRLPSTLFSPNIVPTQMFNGYADEVASLYSGLDLRKFY
ncbi:protein-methionine-sulfoxide reductase catalytic subunit MsrP [Pokkaliibacter plantistimulans]|uniref:Protein-methionine-sulfoxide reductase catalytic subunit MsrP n=1 Tax=Proteobacteria bacterium 228 TaxID=2083153 RepID=A0A2S5KPT9_9PROT|nr:protein-methionine-sulfoxide reductase catalytic subunit MsrP [Pokkaliibacter plantistimulans]PPC76821.1 protein-methionine-sulfoxide reductase catalytic subunit MsrP [Pokkaliibacter plantistimulans]